MIVVDTNIIGYLVVPSEHTLVVERVRAHDDDWVAPALWRSELRNVLVTSVRAGRLGLPRALEALAEADELMCHEDVDVASAEVVELAVARGLSAYDAEFVAVARRTGLPLVTSDRRIVQVCPDIAIVPEDCLARISGL